MSTIENIRLDIEKLHPMPGDLLIVRVAEGEDGRRPILDNRQLSDLSNAVYRCLVEMASDSNIKVMIVDGKCDVELLKAAPFWSPGKKFEMTEQQQQGMLLAEAVEHAAKYGKFLRDRMKDMMARISRNCQLNEEGNEAFSEVMRILSDDCDSDVGDMENFPHVLTDEERQILATAESDQVAALENPFVARKLTPEEREKIVEAIRKSYRGPSAGGDPVVIPADAKIERIPAPASPAAESESPQWEREACDRLSATMRMPLDPGSNPDATISGTATPCDGAGSDQTWRDRPPLI